MGLLPRRAAAPVPQAPGPAAPKARGPEMSERQIRLTWQIAGLLMDYPSESTLSMLDQFTETTLALGEPAGTALRAACEHLRATEPIELAKGYVETFDLKRRHCLHLTYFAYGDTRKRGMALLRFKHAYREAGAELADIELPDYLPVVLEFAATLDPVMGRRLLVEYHPVLELLRQGLHDAGSGYAPIFDALLATLPEMSVADRRRVAELAAQGPPSEEVGLDTFALDPALADYSGAADMGGRR